MASVNLPKFSMSAVSARTTSSVTARLSEDLRSYMTNRYPVPGRQSAVARLPAPGRQSAAAHHPPAGSQPLATYPPSAIYPAVADHSFVTGNHAPVYNPAIVHNPMVGHQHVAALAAPLQPPGGEYQKFRSFDEAYNTPSPILDQHGTEPKREVYKKDLLYYVDDDKLNVRLFF